jgi:hypothetical protein
MLTFQSGMGRIPAASPLGRAADRSRKFGGGHVDPAGELLRRNRLDQQLPDTLEHADQRDLLELIRPAPASCANIWPSTVAQLCPRTITPPAVGTIYCCNRPLVGGVAAGGDDHRVRRVGDDAARAARAHADDAAAI